MLYKQICLVSLTGYGLLTTHTFAGNYYFSADSGDISCVNTTSNDICNFDCNVFQWKQNFDCGQAGQCNIYCSNENCFETSTISASNVVNNLNVYASATGDEKECYTPANFDLPNYGNANFSITGTANNAFKLITINSGTNTNQIIIDCDSDDNKDDCKQITINAQTAQYLEINIGDAMLNGDSKTDDPATINCPQNSNYNGPNSAPCYIKAEGGSIDFVTINTLYGIPMDVYIDGNNILYQDVTITGANIGCTDQTSVGFTTTTIAPITTTVAPTTDAPTTTTTSTTSTTSSPATTSSTSLSTTYSPAYSTTTTAVLSSKSTLYVTDKYISTVSTIFSSTISSILLPIMSVAETVSQTDYSITKDEKMDVNDSLWYIIGVVLFVLICVCCVIDLKKKYNSKSNVSIKDYNNHRESTSLQNNHLNKYDGNNTKHINAISNTIEGDEMILNDINNIVETAGGLHIISDEIVNNNNISGETFNDNLVNVVIGETLNDNISGETLNDIINEIETKNHINDIINEMETNKGDFDSQDDDTIDDDKYFGNGYEMGMVNVHPYKVNINK